MTEQQQIVKDALEYVMASAATGVDKTKLLGALRNLDGTPLSPEQREHVFCIISARGWVTYHLDPLWHAKRWTLTDKGMLALEAM